MSSEYYRERKRRQNCEYRVRLREQTLLAYGGRCACSACAEIRLDRLTLDHVSGNGDQDRRGGRLNFFAKLRKEGWPRQDGLRVLCYNCNCGPHLEVVEHSYRDAAWYRRLKAKTMEVYGGACVCGEAQLEFLTLDHIDPIGKQQNRLTGNRFYRWLQSNGWPMRDQLRVLCFNCNCARQFAGLQLEAI